MLKNLIIAVLSALAGVVITRHIADKNVIELQREFARKEHDTFTAAFSGGWDAGNVNGRKNMWIMAKSGDLPDTWT